MILFGNVAWNIQKNARLSYELTKEYQKIAQKYFSKIANKLMTQMESDNCSSYFRDIWKKLDHLNYDLLTSAVSAEPSLNFQLINQNIIHEVLSSISKNKE